MLRPDVKFGPMNPMRQSLEASCVPTSVSMVLSGFGIDLSESDLIKQYFPSAALQAGDTKAGVHNGDLLRGFVQILSDLGLSDRLQVDAFVPHYWDFTSSSEDRFVVQSDPSAATREKRLSRESPSLVEINAGIEELAQKHDIGIYSGNKRLIKSQVIRRSSGNVERRIHRELAGWVREGHVIGSHGGLTLHVWAIDGFQSTDRGFHVNDPARGTYIENPNTLVSPDSIMGLRGDWFDFITRVSIKKPQPQIGFDRARVWQDLRNRVAFRD